MTSPPATTCDTCGDTLLGPQVAAGHCTRCLFNVTFSDDTPLTESETRAPWTRLSGCDIYEEIGRGGMGVVYRARQNSLDRIVAVKVLLRAPYASVEERARFHREAQAAARLKHPGIVGIFDVGEDDSVPWFSMEYVPGQSLEQRVREHPLPSQDAARCVRQVAQALQHAHDHGVLHRDLKPSNILLDKNSQPRITDFGIAHIATTDTASAPAANLTRTGQALGSPGYAAPEQALKGQAEARTDVYGLGALLYHLLTGRPPFQGPTLDAILMQLRDADPVSPRRLNPSVPTDLETICLKCLHKQPEGRYATAEAVAEDLGRYLDGQVIQARPAAVWTKGWRWAQRNRAFAAMIAAIALLVVAFIGSSLAFARHQARMEHRASLLSDARSLRQLRLAGSQTNALRQLQAAWAIAPSPEIRNEAIACLALPEMSAMRREPLAVPPENEATRLIAGWADIKPGSLLELDDDHKRVAIAEPDTTTLRVLSIEDRRVLFTCQHPARITSLDWGGDLIATACENRFIYIWDDQGQLKHRLSGHQAIPVRVRFRPHSQELCSTASDQYVRIWHAARGVEIVRRELEHEPHSSLWWSADGRRLFAATAHGGMEVYDYQPSPCLELLAPPQEEPHTENLGSADLSVDGNLAVVIDEETSRVWDFSEGRMARRLPKVHGQWMSALFSPDGRFLWTCGWAQELTEQSVTRTSGNVVQFGVPRTLLPGQGSLLRDVSTDGRMLVLSNNGTGQFQVFMRETGKLVRLKHPGTLATAIGPEGTWIATSSYQSPGAKIWSLPSGKLIQTICAKETVMQALASPDNRLIVQTSERKCVFDARTWTLERTLPGSLRLTSMSLSPDGKRLATVGDNDIGLLDTQTYAEVMRLTPPAHAGWLGECHATFSGDGTQLLVHTALGTVMRWDLKALSTRLSALNMAP